MEKKVILDTNFLLVPYKFRVDIFSEIKRIAHFNYGLYVLNGSIEELRQISKAQKGADKKSAEFALKLIKAKDLNIIAEDHGKSVDDSIVSMADPESCIVATLDAELKRKLMSKGVQVIILRQKKYLKIE